MSFLYSIKGFISTQKRTVEPTFTVRSNLNSGTMHSDIRSIAYMSANSHRMALSVSMISGAIFMTIMMLPSPPRHHAAVPYPGSKEPSHTDRSSSFLKDVTMTDRSKVMLKFWYINFSLLYCDRKKARNVCSDGGLIGLANIDL